MTHVFNRKIVRDHLARALKIPSDDFLYKRMADELQERLLDIKRDFETIAEIAPNRFVFTPEFQIKKKTTTALLLSSMYGQGDALIDEEMLPLKPRSLDALVSVGNLHWVNDVPGALIQMHQALKPDGVMMVSCFGGETLFELRDVIMRVEMKHYEGVSPRVSPFITLPDMAALMQRAKFALPVVDYERVTVTYKDLKSLVNDLRAMGQTNAASRRNDKPLSRVFWQDVEQTYRELYATDDGRLIVTIDLFYLIGWAPHESQQKPLQPGSAQHRLADVLKTTEIGTGDFTVQ